MKTSAMIVSISPVGTNRIHGKKRIGGKPRRIYLPLKNIIQSEIIGHYGRRYEVNEIKYTSKYY